jgi:hypothetical protein
MSTVEATTPDGDSQLKSSIRDLSRGTEWPRVGTHHTVSSYHLELGTDTWKKFRTRYGTQGTARTYAVLRTTLLAT